VEPRTFRQRHRSRLQNPAERSVARPGRQLAVR
jgi:hypothetical protein